MVKDIYLTDLVKKVLKILKQPRSDKPHTMHMDHEYPAGDSSYGIAKRLWGLKAFDRSYLINKYAVSLSRILNRLWKNDYILKGVPDYYGGTLSRSYFPVGLKKCKKCANRTHGLYVSVGYIDFDKEKIELPDNTKFWWMLTDKGRELVEVIEKEDE